MSAPSTSAAAVTALAEPARGTFDDTAAVLRTFGPVMRAIAAACGPRVEVVLHNLDGPDVDLDHTIAAIENGHVTGRAVGGPSTNLGVDVQHDRLKDHDAFGYRGFTADGRALHCSSVYFHNSAGEIIAALCVNVDLSAVQQARAVLDALLPPSDSDQRQLPEEHFGRDLPAVMNAMITDAIRRLGRPVSQMSRADRIAVLTQLDERGVTQMRKAVESIAARLGISRVTAYAYLDEARRAS